MRRIVVTTVAAVALLLVGPAAMAGSDSPTPYTVDQTGITLPAGRTFQDNGHVNIRWTGGATGLHFEAKCATRTDAECAGARHDAAQFIGASSIPWTAFGIPTDACVTWVQISDFQEHYGEGGQPPICLTEDPCPTPTTSAPSNGPSPSSTPSPPSSPSPEPSTTPSIVPTAAPSPTPTGTPSSPSSPSPTPSPTVSIAPPPVGTPSTRPTPSPEPSGSPTQPSGMPRSSGELAATGIDGGLVFLLVVLSGLSLLIGWGLVYKSHHEAER